MTCRTKAPLLFFLCFKKRSGALVLHVIDTLGVVLLLSKKKTLLACSYMSLACSEFVLLLPKKNASLALHGIGTPRSILPKTPTRGTCAKGANIVFLLWFFILGEFICRSLWSHSRQPRWSEHLQCWRGQKKGRMSMAMECRGGNNCCSTFRLY